MDSAKEKLDAINNIGKQFQTLNNSLQGLANQEQQSPDIGGLFGGLSGTLVVVNVIVALLGMLYLMYGKRESHVPMMLSGACLCLVPFVLYDVVYLAIVCVLIAVAPFVWDRIDWYV